MNIDTLELLRLRHNYAICKRRLAIRNTKKLPVGTVMGTMNVIRGKLSREIKRISKQVWPETGRPSIKCKHHMVDSPVYNDLRTPMYWMAIARDINEDNNINTACWWR